MLGVSRVSDDLYRILVRTGVKGLGTHVKYLAVPYNIHPATLKSIIVPNTAK